jgi:hypothetical protein
MGLVWLAVSIMDNMARHSASARPTFLSREIAPIALVMRRTVASEFTDQGETSRALAPSKTATRAYSGEKGFRDARLLIATTNPLLHKYDRPLIGKVQTRFWVVQP